MTQLNGLIFRNSHYKRDMFPFLKLAALEKRVDYKQSENTHAVVSPYQPRLTHDERLADNYGKRDRLVKSFKLAHQKTKTH